MPAELDAALWRAVAAFRVAALGYALLSIASRLGGYGDDRPAVAVAAVMVVWTAVMLVVPHWRTWLVLDVVVALGCQQASVLALSDHQISRGDPTLPVTWVAGPVLAWAVRREWVGGLVVSLVLAVGAVVERGGLSQATVNSIVLLILGGTVVGYLVTIGRRAEKAYAEAVRLAAETSERERLARSVHDGVLQTLALVARTSTDPSLVSMATGQEQALRRLVTEAPSVGTGLTDLRTLLPARPGVEVAAPASAVALPAPVAHELAAAIGACVDNALQHGGSTAWVLVEDLASSVVVSVRDDGPGVSPERLAAAAAEGRMGVARSIRGRIEDLGGTVTVDSAPGQGTEVEICVVR
ncbi:MAG: MacS family sensor histidine kinase [Mycobacteriales bacterium]